MTDITPRMRIKANKAAADFIKQCEESLPGRTEGLYDELGRAGFTPRRNELIKDLDTLPIQNYQLMSRLKKTAEALQSIATVEELKAFGLGVEIYDGQNSHSPYPEVADLTHMYASHIGKALAASRRGREPVRSGSLSR